MHETQASPFILLEMGSVSRKVPGISLRSRGSGQWGSPRDSKPARRDPWCAPVSCAGQYGVFIWALHVPQSTLTMSWDSTFTNQIYWIHWNQKISYPKLKCSMFECQILNDEYNIKVTFSISTCISKLSQHDCGFIRPSGWSPRMVGHTL